MKLKRFLEDSKRQPQFMIIGKTSIQSETYSEPSKITKMEPFAYFVECFLPLTIFAKHSISGVSQGRYASGKSNEKLGALLFISQKIKTAISAVFFHF